MSDYPRTGVFIEEVNGSQFETQAPQETIINFVPGFSRKGTVFNRPVVIKSTADRKNTFGDIDRFLEKKGSYFHRTIDIALQTAPVQAMNLLKTTSLDQLNYASISLSAQYDNEPIATRQYDDFFNKAGFWQRDTDSFLAFAKDTERMIHFTNVSDKKISFFLFKSAAAGFDITAETWYGGKDNVPTWMNYNDLISDYMVRLVVVGGDWSNYPMLGADTNWSKYFNGSGLRKNKVDDFIRDRNVSLLGDYTASLIPYFTVNNRNIFIETLVNTQTDKTGLFCSFDITAVETDLPNGNIDIIGQTLVGLEKSKINFMSYQDTIEEVDSYDTALLDTLGNVIGIDAISGRTTVNTNGNISGMANVALVGPTTATPSMTFGSLGTAIINNASVAITGSVAFTAITGTPGAGNSFYRIDTVYVSPTGVLTVLDGTPVEFVSGTAIGSVTGLTFPANYPNNSIVLGYIFREKDDSAAYTAVYTAVAIQTGASNNFVPLTIGTAATDIIVAATATNILDMTFTGTAAATKAQYKEYRRLQFFNELATKYVLANSVIIGAAGIKVDLTSASITHNMTSVIGDKNIVITVTGFDIRTAPAAGDFVFYYNDNEFTVGQLGIETRQTVTGTSGYGVVSKNSEFYQDFYNGMINTGDYFYEKAAVSTNAITFIHFTDLTYPLAIGDYIVMHNTDAAALGIGSGANTFSARFDANIVNKGVFSIGEGYPNGVVGPIQTALGAALPVNHIAFSVAELVSNETVASGLDIFNQDRKAYLKMYSIGKNIKVDFCNDATLTAPFSIAGGLASINTTINVYSGEASYEQTLEIEQHASYVMTDNKVLIDSVRYPEVKVGSYVRAYFDNAELEPGEYPKKFARIIKKTPWSGNAANGVQYSEITTDVKIDIADYSGDLQTTWYTTLESYVDTYKTVTLNGFTVQATSVPNGTETRQEEILNIIAKDTPLYKAIVNKNTFNFRYLIDSFGLGLTAFSKQQLADITGKRKNCIAFLNMPSAKMFRDSSNPSFINDDNTLNLEFVRLGGDPDQNPAFLYTFAQGDGRDDGRDTVGYFFPYVGISDNGRPMSFPPAAYVANTYMRKNNSAIPGKYNFTVAAGTEDGRVLGIAGTEMDFTEDDYISMNQMGCNPISYAKNIGWYIETEYTASQAPKSALSYLHVREILIDLENELYAMLFKYQYKFNIPAVRAKIKREADDICQKYLDRSAITAFTNVIDDTNNTADLIDNQFGLLNTYITPVRAMATIVNVIGIQSNGAVGTSTGFN